MNFKNNISVVSIFPSPIEKEYVVSSLLSKGSYAFEEQTNEIDKRILNQYDKSNEIWQLWNSWIKKYCLKYKVKNLVLFPKNELQPEFYDPSKLTVHLRYVPVLKLVQKHIPIKFDSQKAE